jgi:hypothetical protein
VLERVHAGQDAGVRGQRDDRVRVGECEANALGREPIDVRRPRRSAVDAERVGSERVDGDEQDVLIRNLSKSQPTRASGAGTGGERRSNHKNPPHRRAVSHIPKP